MTVTAIIVTFNPPGDFIGRLEQVSTEVDEVIIVDNGSNNMDETFDKIQNSSKTITIIRNNENIGLAIALNQGITAAKDARANWVLLLDHDSQPQPGMVKKMLETHQNHPKPEDIALIAPEIKDINTNTAEKYLLPKGKFWFKRATINEPYNDEVLTVITSGSLLKTSIFDEIGLMKEHLFIDYIDHDYCLRIKDSGKKILLVKDAILQHQLGDKTEHNLLGKSITTPHHSAFRRFYIFRNRIWSWKNYAVKFPGFVIHDFLAAIFDIFRITIYEEQKFQKLSAVFKGIFAGICREK